MYPYASSGLRLEICRSFNRFAANLTDEHKSLTADLMYRMLSDENPSIQQQAFEAFEHLTIVSQSMDILSSVAVAVRNGRSDVSTALSEYIADRVPQDFDLEDFFAKLCACEAEIAGHVCFKSDRANREKIPRLDEPVGDPVRDRAAAAALSETEEAEKQLDKCCTDMQLMIQLKRYLKKDSYERLRQVCLDFLEQCDQ
jgi:hypothetical protein